jgi:hypothetical protein
MDPIILKNQTPQGEPLEAVYLPDQGMNMMSFKKGGIEVIDQSTRSLFEERYAGLGALIGPHFHRKKEDLATKLADESAFPHIARVRAKGVADPFSHGIARYAPWKAEATPTQIKAQLTGKDVWNGVPLSTLEGQSFKIDFSAELTPDGLQLELSVVSDTDSLVGIHYYYHLPQGRGKVVSAVQSHYLDHSGSHPITALPPSWKADSQQAMTYDLNDAADYTFFPFPNPLEGKIWLDAGSYRLLTTYSCSSEENCWQLYHPEGASFVCIEPISSQDPRHPNLTVSSIRISLQIL